MKKSLFSDSSASSSSKKITPNRNAVRHKLINVPLKGLAYKVSMERLHSRIDPPDREPVHSHCYTNTADLAYCGEKLTQKANTYKGMFGKIHKGIAIRTSTSSLDDEFSTSISISPIRLNKVLTKRDTKETIDEEKSLFFDCVSSESLQISSRVDFAERDSTTMTTSTSSKDKRLRAFNIRSRKAHTTRLNTTPVND